ncbi:acyl-CoA/acyl-ACP dehydrogenase [Gordonia McavH-238-E]|uniref:acyl-CoA dehydrogenase family protein n=1 Tax=Gordonia sp. McavH-238-E TaxID=2917736 RepID=UPI001EF49083|nr:acyl-CoA dehydrogenase family protein [Gordonia sp. McavH-238-E]MCG7632820.1 acyl-CoA/acyl-ACP dehydrogenase [Gordonia sp. McavH-238-E]
MSLTVEQADLVAALRDFCQRELGTREQRDALTHNGEHAHSDVIYAKLAQAGYLGISIPEEYGGSGGGLMDQCLLHEELYRGLAPVHAIGSTHTVAGIYKRFATETQKKATLSAISNGAPMSISISEPEAGSDAANIGCRAEKVDGGYRINGQKTWCSAAQHAKAILLVARTSRGERRHEGLSMFEVPADAPGLSIVGIDTMGGALVNDLYFTDVFVPDSDVVGTVGNGWHQLMAGLNGERLVAGVEALGMAQRTFDDLLGYLRERKQFGKTIGSFQAVRHRVADLAIEIEASRALAYATVAAVEAGTAPADELVRKTSITKVKLTETAKAVALEGVQLMGGYGYAVEYGMEKNLRDAIAPTIYAGTNEIQREVISGTLGMK